MEGGEGGPAQWLPHLIAPLSFVLRKARNGRRHRALSDARWAAAAGTGGSTPRHESWRGKTVKAQIAK